MSALDVEEVIEMDEVCTNCKHRMGPVLLICGSPQSEFFQGPVHPEGWCYFFSRAPIPTGERSG